jgi:hypothetical protein
MDGAASEAMVAGRQWERPGPDFTNDRRQDWPTLKAMPATVLHRRIAVDREPVGPPTLD